MGGGEDWKQIYDMVVLMGPIAYIVFLFVLTFFLIAAWNIVTAVFLEKAMKKAEEDVDRKTTEKRREDRIRMKEFLERIKKMDKDGNHRLGKKEFTEALEDPGVASYFELRGLDVIDAESFFD